jgi:hypothetical protein
MKKILSLALITLFGCAGARQGAPDDCGPAAPRDIKGLVIDGPRPRQNVIENLAPILCNWRKQCKTDNRSDLTGTIVLKIVVDKVGDIGVLGYESTIKDTVYVERLISGLHVLDFDPWNDKPGETRIQVPIQLMK